MMRTLALLALLPGLIGANWGVQPHSTWAGNPAVSVTYHLQENGADIVGPTTLAGPFAAGVSRPVSADAYLNSGRRICLKAKARSTTPLTQPDSPEVENCATFAAPPPPPPPPVALAPPTVTFTTGTTPPPPPPPDPNTPSSSTWGPTSFNDPRFVNMTQGALGCGAVRNRSQTARGPNFCSGASSWSMVRTDVTDDSLQMGAGANFTLTDAYLHTCDATGMGDHADNIQSWVAGDMSITATRVTFDQTQSAACDNVGTGIRNGDLGRIALLKLDHAYFKGGQGLRSYTPDGTPFAGMHVWLDGVCFDGTDGVIGAWNGGTITVDRYANVFTGCSIVNGQVVTGTPLKCSSLVTPSPSGTPTVGKVLGCPN